MPLKKGDRFGEWTVMRRSHTDKNSRAVYMCRCTCGTEKAVQAQRLISGESRSCRCKQGVYAAAARKAAGTRTGRKAPDAIKLWHAVADGVKY